MVYPCLPLSLVTTYLTPELQAFLQLLCHFYWQLRKLLFIFNNSADISSLPHEELIILFQSILWLQLEQIPHSPPETMGSGCKDSPPALFAGAWRRVSTEWTPRYMALFQLDLQFIWPQKEFSTFSLRKA